ncbi:unnamed protein product [Trichobilharzia regenti]|nr:unnamed protein product [Trichobilharzia regenti]
MSSKYRKIGESGKSPKELEKIIVCLKKVLKRSQAENERLKCAPGPVSQSQLQQYKAEIKRLQSELETAQLVAGARLLDRRVANEQGTTKLMHEYDNLRKSYEEITTKNQEMKNQMRQLRQEMDKIKNTPENWNPDKRTDEDQS